MIREDIYLEPGTWVENEAPVTSRSGQRFAAGELRGAVLTCYLDPHLDQYCCRILTETGGMVVCASRDLRVLPEENEENGE